MTVNRTDPSPGRFIAAAAQVRRSSRSRLITFLVPLAPAPEHDIAAISGTKRVSRVEENTAADRIELSSEQIARLNDLTPAAGERHNEANMSTIDR